MRNLIKGSLKSIILAGLCSIFLNPLHAAPRDELKELRKSIAALQKELESAEEIKSEAADALKQSEQAISRINSKLQELNQGQRQLDNTLAQLQQQTRAGQQQLNTQRELLGRLLLRQYQQGEQGYLKILLNQQDPNQAMRQLSYYAYLSQARVELISGLRQNLQRLRALARLTREKNAALERIRTEQNTQKQQLLVEQNARKNVLARLSKKIQSQRKEMGRLVRDEKRLTRLVERLSRIVPGRKEGVRNSKLPDAGTFGIPFAQLKGKLRLPVRGELASRFGSPREDGGALWRGLFIRAPGGEEVKAVADGQVVFADWLRGFGNLLIVDHGGGYMSLYSNNETLYKQIGDNVRSGDTVASVGNSGGNPESGLYFELRFQSKTFDPMQWVTLK